MGETVPLFNANDRISGRDGGPYLDLEQAKEAEHRRAEIEGRKPDYENPGGFAGIQLNTAGQQALTVGVAGLASQESRNITDDDVTFKGAVESKDTLLQPFAERDALDGLDNGPVFGVRGLADTNPAAIATGSQADGEKTAGSASKEIQKASTPQPDNTRKRAKKTAKKTVPAKKPSQPATPV